MNFRGNDGKVQELEKSGRRGRIRDVRNLGEILSVGFDLGIWWFL